MLDNTYLILYNNDTSSVEIYDKNITAVVHSFSITGVFNVMVYDEDRAKLWITNTANQLFRYGLSETGGVPSAALETTITTATYFAQGSMRYNRMCIDESNGTLYGLSGVGLSTGLIFSVLVDGTAINGSLSVSTVSPTVTQNAYNSGLCFNQYSKEIYVYYSSYFSASASFTSETPGATIQVVKADLTSYEYNTFSVYSSMPLLRGNYSTKVANSSTAYNDVNYVMSTHGIDAGLFNRESAFNPVTGRIIMPCRAGEKSVWSSDANGFAKTHIINIAELNDLHPKVYCSKTSGKVYLVTLNHTIKLDYDMNVEEIRPFGSSVFVFNEYTDTYYIYDGAIKKIAYYDNNGIKITETSNDFFTVSSPKMLVLPGLTDSVPSAIRPNSIVYPDRNSAIADTTPTIVVRVGDSLDGWTQQFRVVADTDFNTISNGGPEDTYMRQSDSFASGSYYDASYGWEYSTDWSEASGDPSTGTWSALGTGDGMQSGGSEPTNGVLCETITDRYLKFTIPAADELTGAASNTKWYFNIFSYSAS